MDDQPPGLCYTGVDQKDVTHVTVVKKMSIKDILGIPEVKRRISLPCHFPKGYTIHHEQDICDSVGIILEGVVTMVHHTAKGEAVLLAELAAESLFGDFLVHASIPRYPGDIIVKEDASIIHIDKDDIEDLLRSSSAFRAFYMQHIGDKALSFNMQNKLLRQPTLRDKVLFHIEQARTRTGTPRVEFRSKAELARYYNVQRPSLSRELARMKAEGMIDYNLRSMWIL